MQAHIIQGALESESIESVLHNENFSALMAGYGNEIAGVDIMIAESDYEHACEVLKNGGFAAEERKLCPSCGSSDITYRPRKDRKIKMFFALLSSVFSTTPGRNRRWEFHCNKCDDCFENPTAGNQPKRN